MKKSCKDLFIFLLFILFINFAISEPNQSYSEEFTNAPDISKSIKQNEDAIFNFLKKRIKESTGGSSTPTEEGKDIPKVVQFPPSEEERKNNSTEESHDISGNGRLNPILKLLPTEVKVKENDYDFDSNDYYWDVKGDADYLDPSKSKDVPINQNDESKTKDLSIPKPLKLWSIHEEKDSTSRIETYPSNDDLFTLQESLYNSFLQNEKDNKDAHVFNLIIAQNKVKGKSTFSYLPEKEVDYVSKPSSENVLDKMKKVKKVVNSAVGNNTLLQEALAQVVELPGKPPIVKVIRSTIPNLTELESTINTLLGSNIRYKKNRADNTVFGFIPSGEESALHSLLNQTIGLSYREGTSTTKKANIVNIFIINILEDSSAEDVNLMNLDSFKPLHSTESFYESKHESVTDQIKIPSENSRGNVQNPHGLNLNKNTILNLLPNFVKATTIPPVIPLHNASVYKTMGFRPSVLGLLPNQVFDVLDSNLPALKKSSNGGIIRKDFTNRNNFYDNFSERLYERNRGKDTEIKNEGSVIESNTGPNIEIILKNLERFKRKGTENVSDNQNLSNTMNPTRENSENETQYEPHKNLLELMQILVEENQIHNKKNNLSDVNVKKNEANDKIVFLKNDKNGGTADTLMKAMTIGALPSGIAMATALFPYWAPMVFGKRRKKRNALVFKTESSDIFSDIPERSKTFFEKIILSNKMKGQRKSNSGMIVDGVNGIDENLFLSNKDRNNGNKFTTFNTSPNKKYELNVKNENLSKTDKPVKVNTYSALKQNSKYDFRHPSEKWNWRIGEKKSETKSSNKLQLYKENLNQLLEDLLLQNNDLATNNSAVNTVFDSYAIDNSTASGYNISSNITRRTEENQVMELNKESLLKTKQNTSAENISQEINSVQGTTNSLSSLPIQIISSTMLNNFQNQIENTTPQNLITYNNSMAIKNFLVSNNSQVSEDNNEVDSIFKGSYVDALSSTPTFDKESSKKKTNSSLHHQLLNKTQINNEKPNALKGNSQLRKPKPDDENIISDVFKIIDILQSDTKKQIPFNSSIDNVESFAQLNKNTPTTLKEDFLNISSTLPRSTTSSQNLFDDISKAVSISTEKYVNFINRNSEVIKSDVPLDALNNNFNYPSKFENFYIKASENKIAPILPNKYQKNSVKNNVLLSNSKPSETGLSTSHGLNFPKFQIDLDTLLNLNNNFLLTGNKPEPSIQEDKFVSENTGDNDSDKLFEHQPVLEMIIHDPIQENNKDQHSEKPENFNVHSQVNVVDSEALNDVKQNVEDLSTLLNHNIAPGEEASSKLKDPISLSHTEVKDKNFSQTQENNDVLSDFSQSTVKEWYNTDSYQVETDKDYEYSNTEENTLSNSVDNKDNNQRQTRVLLLIKSVVRKQSPLQ
ncbi:UNVERIFIED_CONTAM: hypothetical protein RMT77_012123 [Armadillidium vulgare]